MTLPWLTVALIVSHCSVVRRTFFLAVTVASVSPYSICLAPLLRFSGLMTWLLSASSYSDVSLIIAYTSWRLLMLWFGFAEKIVGSSS
jgi:hypothetical protein